MQHLIPLSLIHSHLSILISLSIHVTVIDAYLNPSVFLASLPHNAICLPTNPLFLKSKNVNAITPNGLSDVDIHPCTYPVVYSPVPINNTLGGGNVGVINGVRNGVC